jgi:hypothetical protein
LIRRLAVLSGLLVAVIGLEVSAGSGPETAVRLDAPSAQAVVARPKGADDPTDKTVGHWADTVLGRPLFAPDRRPSASVVAADIGLPRLAGIIASSADTIAIFQPASGGKPVVAHDGDSVGGWQVTVIESDGVSLAKAKDRIILRPRFTDAAASAGGTAPAAAATTPPKPQAGAAAKPEPSRWEAAADSGMLRARWSNPQLQP